MNSKFTKIHGAGEDLIWVTIQQGEIGPEVVISATSDDSLVCSMKTTLTDDDDGWETARKLFIDLDEERARQYVDYMINHEIS